MSGRQAVANALEADSEFVPDLIVAVGKAAASMCRGALETLSTPTRALVVTKYEHGDAALAKFPDIEIIEAGHPVPDAASLQAGAAVLDAICNMPHDSRLLLLVSGGASVLVECLEPAWDLPAWQAMNDRMLASGEPIERINRAREKASRIKGGKLLAAFKGREALVYVISDVEGDDIGTIGSGIGDARRATCAAHTRIVASNALARVACAAAAGIAVRCNEESLYDDVFELAPLIGAALINGEPGLYIWGGEPTICLPAKPGRGGRNQSLALAIAREISGHGNITVLVAGTDGTDGPTDAAGAMVDGSTFDAGGERALRAADAGPYLEERDALFVTGPTGTNVMDVVIALVE